VTTQARALENLRRAKLDWTELLAAAARRKR
jgi:hypothetical protein